MGLVGQFNFQGLVTCAIIVAGLGVLNDVTITQSSAVWELRAAAPELSRRGLFGSVMRIGRDHIASTIYTIVFAYAGAAVSVLLVLFFYERPILDLLGTEDIAAEVVRTLAGSMGLVLAVSITAIATLTVSGAMSEEQHPDSPYQRPEASPHDCRSAKRAQGAGGHACRPWFYGTLWRCFTCG